jgi:hypothetical protein
MGLAGFGPVFWERLSRVVFTKPSEDVMAKADHEVTIQVEGGYLAARAAGERSLNAVTSLAVQIAQAATDAQVGKVLVDVRDLRGRLRVLDSFLVVNSVFDSLRGKGLRQAAIVDRGMPPIRGWTFEIIARNRGFNLRIFTSREEAVEWLEAS